MVSGAGDIAYYIILKYMLLNISTDSTNLISNDSKAILLDLCKYIVNHSEQLEDNIYYFNHFIQKIIKLPFMSDHILEFNDFLQRLIEKQGTNLPMVIECITMIINCVDISQYFDFFLRIFQCEHNAQTYVCVFKLSYKLYFNYQFQNSMSGYINNIPHIISLLENDFFVSAIKDFWCFINQLPSIIIDPLSMILFLQFAANTERNYNARLISLEIFDILLFNYPEVSNDLLYSIGSFLIEITAQISQERKNNYFPYDFNLCDISYDSEQRIIRYSHWPSIGRLFSQKIYHISYSLLTNNISQDYSYSALVGIRHIIDDNPNYAIMSIDPITQVIANYIDSDDPICRATALLNISLIVSSNYTRQNLDELIGLTTKYFDDPNILVQFYSIICYDTYIQKFSNEFSNIDEILSCFFQILPAAHHQVQAQILRCMATIFAKFPLNASVYAEHMIGIIFNVYEQYDVIENISVRCRAHECLYSFYNVLDIERQQLIFNNWIIYIETNLHLFSSQEVNYIVRIFYMLIDSIPNENSTRIIKILYELISIIPQSKEICKDEYDPCYETEYDCIKVIVDETIYIYSREYLELYKNAMLTLKKYISIRSDLTHEQFPVELFSNLFSMDFKIDDIKIYAFKISRIVAKTIADKFNEEIPGLIVLFKQNSTFYIQYQILKLLNKLERVLFAQGQNSIDYITFILDTKTINDMLNQENNDKYFRKLNIQFGKSFLIIFSILPQEISSAVLPILNSHRYLEKTPLMFYLIILNFYLSNGLLNFIEEYLEYIFHLITLEDDNVHHIVYKYLIPFINSIPIEKLGTDKLLALIDIIISNLNKYQSSDIQNGIIILSLLFKHILKVVQFDELLSEINEWLLLFPNVILTKNYDIAYEFALELFSEYPVFFQNDSNFQKYEEIFENMPNDENYSFFIEKYQQSLQDFIFNEEVPESQIEEAQIYLGDYTNSFE